MLGESQLNVYILGAELSPRQRQRIQAQVQTALRSLPPWVFNLVSRRIAALGVRNFPLIIEPQDKLRERPQVLSLGRIDNRPAVRLMPQLTDNGVTWGQGHRYLIAKAVAYLAAPEPSDAVFWEDWSSAIEGDRLRDVAGSIDKQWQGSTDLGLLVEIFAAFAISPAHERWGRLPRLRAFMADWSGA